MASVWISPELHRIVGRAASAPSDAAPLRAFVIQRSGGRPLRFDGMLMLSHEADPARRSHAIRLYERRSGGYVVEIALTAASGDIVPHVAMAEAETLEEAADFLRDYDPASEARLTVPHDARGAMGLAGQAAALAAEIDGLREDYTRARSAILAAALIDNEISGRRVN
jgi:hypothetical protein